MILNKYYDISFLKLMDLYSINILFLDALEKEREDIIHSTWRELYPFMLSGFIPFIDFNEFENKFIGSKICELTNEEIEKEFEQIILKDRQVV